MKKPKLGRRFPGVSMGEKRMDILSCAETVVVGGGVINSPETNIRCTVGTSGINCEGSMADWGGAISDAYNWAVDRTTDAMEWIGNHI
jgi:hypothetical protein